MISYPDACSCCNTILNKIWDISALSWLRRKLACEFSHLLSISRCIFPLLFQASCLHAAARTQCVCFWQMVPFFHRKTNQNCLQVKLWLGAIKKIPFDRYLCPIFPNSFLSASIETLVIHAHAKIGIPLTWTPKWIFNLISVDHSAI